MEEQNWCIVPLSLVTVCLVGRLLGTKTKIVYHRQSPKCFIGDLLFSKMHEEVAMYWEHLKPYRAEYFGTEL